MTAHPIHAAAKLAAAALTMALDTERRATLEVEARGGERSARMTLAHDRKSAAMALTLFAVPLAPHLAVEALEMADGVARGYARDGWVIRVMRIAAESMPGETYCGGCDKWGVTADGDGRHKCGGKVAGDG